jgi:hypothetical protein
LISNVPFGFCRWLHLDAKLNPDLLKVMDNNNWFKFNNAELINICLIEQDSVSDETDSEIRSGY